VLAKGPGHLGVVTLKEGAATIELDPKSGATIDGKPAKSATLLDDSHDTPTTVAFGTASFYLVDRNGKKGLRVKDSAADARTHFTQIDNFATDPTWRIEAKWIAFDPPHTLETPNVLGQTDTFPVPGKAEFTRGGKTYELLPVVEVPGDPGPHAHAPSHRPYRVSGASGRTPSLASRTRCGRWPGHSCLSWEDPDIGVLVKAVGSVMLGAPTWGGWSPGMAISEPQEALTATG